jgi:hypothetical protein
MRLMVEDFLSYLEKLETAFPGKLRKKIEELYGPDWLQTSTRLY